MKIVKIWDADYPWDVRVEKIGQALHAAGYELHLVCRNTARRAFEEQVGAFRVHRLKALPLLNYSLGFPAFLNPRWITRIGSVVDHVQAHVILVRDLPLAPAAIFIGSRRRLPVVLDMAENYPAMIRDLWTGSGLRPLDVFVRNPALVERVERWAVRHVARIIVVVDEARDRLVKLGVPRERVSVVSNTPPLARLSEARRPKRLQRTVYRLAYIGLLEFHRGLETAIRAFARVRDDRDNWRLEIIGDGRDASRLKLLTTKLCLNDRVRFHGWIEYGAARKLIATCDAGLIPHHSNETWNTTIPNKLFDYMAAGVAVIASDVRPVARIVGETNAGRCFRDRDPEDLARLLRGLESSDLDELSRAGREAIVAKYNWERDAEALVAALRWATDGC